MLFGFTHVLRIALLILWFCAGALNLTREAYNRAQQVKLKNMNTATIVSEADRSCKKTEAVMNKYSAQFSQGLQENDNNLQKLSNYVSSLEMQIPGLNQQVTLRTLHKFCFWP